MLGSLYQIGHDKFITFSNTPSACGEELHNTNLKGGFGCGEGAEG
jgi:hypothetical protein